VNELALFAGAGGGLLASRLLGWRTVCAVENDPVAAGVLLARQNDGCLEPFPVWDDVRTFDGKAWRGVVDVISGGFPCQDISAAGKGAGLEGSRSGLWREMARIVGAVRPSFVFVENSPLLVRRGLANILVDLAGLGFDATWGIVSADSAGAPHERERFWLVAYDPDAGDAGRKRKSRRQDSESGRVIRSDTRRSTTTPKSVEIWNRGIGELVASGVTNRTDSYGGALRVLHGMAHRVDRLEVAGNGQVPAVARIAWETLTEV
jgi:DNA (cytosine-5)-methyltransferase 1